MRRKINPLWGRIAYALDGTGGDGIRPRRNIGLFLRLRGFALKQHFDFVGGLIEECFQCDIGSAQACDHIARPLDVFDLAVQRPSGWRIADIVDVADLVGQFDQLGTKGDREGLVDLEAFAFGSWEGFVVGDFLDKVADIFAELCGDLFGHGLGVFEHVVQHSGKQDIAVAHTAHFPKQIKYMDQVVDVGTLGVIFASLIAVAVGGEVQRADHGVKDFFGKHRVALSLCCFGVLVFWVVSCRV